MLKNKEQIKYSARRSIPDSLSEEENNYSDNKIITLKVPNKKYRKKKKNYEGIYKGKCNLPFIKSKMHARSKNSLSRWDVEQTLSESIQNTEDTF